MNLKRIGIIGTGNVGTALAKRLVETGYYVKVANSRGPESLRDFENLTKAEAVNINEVMVDVDILIIAIPLNKVTELRQPIKSLSQKAIIVDTGNYIPQLNGSIAAIDQGLPESIWVSQQLGLPVIKAFNNIIAQGVAENGKQKGDPGRIALPVAGDDQKSKNSIMEFIEDLGFTAFDAGPLSDSWRMQPGQPVYATDPLLKELPTLLKRANREKAPANRDKAMKIMAKVPLTFPAAELVRVSRLTAGLDVLKPRSWYAILHLGFVMMRS